MKGLFWTASFLYGLVIRLRNLLFDLNVLKTIRLPTRVISVGNLTAGGTGKTPLVLHLGRLFNDQQIRFGVLSRGYGRQSLRPFLLHGAKTVTASDIGDEPKMIGEKLGCFLGISANRVKTGHLLLRKYGAMTLLLDDGFSHRRIQRDLNLVTLNAADPFSNGILPYGLRREPLSALKRADAFILIRSSGTPEPEKVEKQLRSLGLHRPLFTAFKAADKIVTPSGEAKPITDFTGNPFFLFSGIAGGEAFVRFAANLGLSVAGQSLFPDHFNFTLSDLNALRTEAGALPLLTTEKDYWRLFPNTEALYYLQIRLVFDAQKAFESFLFGACPNP